MDDPRKTDSEKGDEVLRRLLKTRPDPKTGKGEKVTKVKLRESGGDQAAKRR